MQPLDKVIQVCHAFLSITSWHVDGRRRNRKLNSINRKTENHIGHQIRKTSCVVAENRKPNAVKGNNCNLRQTTKLKDRSFLLQKLKSQPEISPKPKIKLFGFTLLVWHKCFGNKQQTNTCYYCCDYYYYYFFIIITAKEWILIYHTNARKERKIKDEKNI